VQIVENTAPLWSGKAAWMLATEPTVVIGADQEDATQHLFGVIGAELLGDDLIVVANRGTTELLVFAQRREAFLRQNPAEARLTPELDAFPALPTRKPAYSRLVLDDEGNLWVRQYPHYESGTPGIPVAGMSDGPETWWVFDPTGQLLSTVRTPSSLEVLAVHGGTVIALWLDEDDVEQVRLYPPLKPDA
jgi:hypothetical protein